MNRLKVLVSAYACCPDEGSEPGVGWNVVGELSKYHDVWVLTREDNRPSIEAELIGKPLSGLQFIYCGLPHLVEKLNDRQRLVHLHYYLWQLTIYFVALNLHKELKFDIIHHVTYVRYSSPSFLSLLPLPFVWGPVGGGELAPRAFWKDFSFRGKVYEIVRGLAHRLGELDPFTRLTLQRSVLVRATTEETANRLRQMGTKEIQICVESGLSEIEIKHLAQLSLPSSSSVRFISMARLLHWKGLHLGIRAFAQANLPNTEYWILGDGPEKKQLQTLVENLKIADRVKFWGKLPRHETLQKLAESHVLIHPSLHDSGGWVCLEAMAAGRPVVCLNLGGPAIQVTEETGFKIAAHTPEQAIREMAVAMASLAEEPELRLCIGQAGQKRVRECYSWTRRGHELSKLYEKIVGK